MAQYNYHDAICADIRDYIESEEIKVYHSNREEVEEKLNDILWTSDSVTGNGSGSYTFNTWQAEENICHNLDLLAEACREFGCNIDILEEGAEAADVTIRCYLLGQCLAEVLDDIEEDDPEDEDDENDDENI